MADGRHLPLLPVVTMSPQQVAHRGFALVRRGFDPADVRAFLDQVGAALTAFEQREAELLRRLDLAETKASNPELDEATLTAALGQETARVLKSAHDAAADVTTRAEDEAGRILREAEAEASRIREQASTVLADRAEEAETEAAEIRRTARAEAASELGGARQSSDAMVGGAREECRDMVREAQELRARTLSDLARRRRILHTQVEQLRAGRVSLTEAIDAARHQIDRIHDELRKAENDARTAAENAAKKAAAEPEQTGEDLARSMAHPSRGKRAELWNAGFKKPDREPEGQATQPKQGGPPGSPDHPSRTGVSPARVAAQDQPNELRSPADPGSDPGPGEESMPPAHLTAAPSARPASPGRAVARGGR